VAANAVLRLQPRPDPVYRSCPEWCLDHYDEQGVRRHHGLLRTIVARAAGTGARAEVRLWAELLDDGAGGDTTQAYFLEVGGVQLELTVGRMHDLMQATENVFWRLDAHGQMYAPRDVARPAEPARPTSRPTTAPVVAPRAQSHGGRS
jgi:hypothetical protein